jgi:hypothetical protein
MRTSSNTWRRRTGNAFAVSADGTVIVGAQEHNVGTTPTADPDGGRPVVWRWNAGTSTYDMTFLPNGVNASSFPYTYSMTAGTFFINQAGTIIVGKAADNAGNLFIAKWNWNSGSSSWDAPVNLGSDLTTPASWLPQAVTSCGIPPTLTPTGMSDDGSIVVGMAVYSTCGSFMSGGFIWQNIDGNVIRDWYDYLASLNTPGITDNYGPTGDNGDPTRGLPKLGFPVSISSNGNAVVGIQGGTQRIPGAVPSLVLFTGGPSCVPPTITMNPANNMFTRCSFGTTLGSIIESAAAAGTLPMSYQWSKDGNQLFDGGTASGSTITGSATIQVRVITPGPADAGNYSCTVTGCGATTATTTAATVQTDPAAAPPPNDTCATATAVGEGTFNFNICGAYVADGINCTGGTEVGDVFYRYTPTFTGEARFQTCGSTFDTGLEVLSDCGGGVLACNNDVTSRGLVGTTCSSSRSLISRLSVTAGVPVIVRVSALGAPFTNSPTSGALTISQAPAAPVNDLCSNATVVGLGTFAFNLAEAADDYTMGTDVCSGAGNTTSNRDVWFKVNAPCGGTISVDTCGSTITNPMLHIMSADCFGTILACNDNVGTVTGCTSNQARITNYVASGPVLIRVAASGSSAPNSGLGQITITGTITPCCGSADFNCDGDVGTDADIESFFACLSGSCPAAPCTGTADFNGDGDVGTDADIEAFFRVLGGGTC